MLNLSRSIGSKKREEFGEASRRNDEAYAELRDALRRLLEERNRNGKAAKENAQ